MRVNLEVTAKATRELTLELQPKLRSRPRLKLKLEFKRKLKLRLRLAANMPRGARLSDADFLEALIDNGLATPISLSFIERSCFEIVSANSLIC